MSAEGWSRIDVRCDCGADKVEAHAVHEHVGITALRKGRGDQGPNPSSLDVGLAGDEVLVHGVEQGRVAEPLLVRVSRVARWLALT